MLFCHYVDFSATALWPPPSSSRPLSTTVTNDEVSDVDCTLGEQQPKPSDGIPAVLGDNNDDDDDDDDEEEYERMELVEYHSAPNRCFIIFWKIFIIRSH